MAKGFDHKNKNKRKVFRVYIGLINFNHCRFSKPTIKVNLKSFALIILLLSFTINTSKSSDTLPEMKKEKHAPDSSIVYKMRIVYMKRKFSALIKNTKSAVVLSKNFTCDEKFVTLSNAEGNRVLVLTVVGKSRLDVDYEGLKSSAIIVVDVGVASFFNETAKLGYSDDFIVKCGK